MASLLRGERTVGLSVDGIMTWRKSFVFKWISALRRKAGVELGIDGVLHVATL